VLILERWQRIQIKRIALSKILRFSPRTGRQARFVFDKLTAAGIPAQLALKHTRDTPAALKLMAAMRTLSGKGAYCDLDGIAGLSGSGISKETLSIFKQWAYGKQLRLSTALRSAKRIPIPGMSQRRQIRLAALCDFMERLGRETKEMGIAQAMAHIVANTTLANRIDAEQLDKVVSQALRYGHPSELLTDKLALEHDADRFQSGIEKVAVMTLHASKGLEFSTVFVAGCEDGLIPYEQPGQKNEVYRRRAPAVLRGHDQGKANAFSNLGEAPHHQWKNSQAAGITIYDGH
jgi:DNA helicase-2/ATP-dependent DNA helicase PcrA